MTVAGLRALLAFVGLEEDSVVVVESDQGPLSIKSATIDSSFLGGRSSLVFHLEQPARNDGAPA